MAHSSWCTGKNMEMSMTNGYLKWGYYMPKRQLKTIGQRFRVKTYKEGDKTSV